MGSTGMNHAQRMQAAGLGVVRGGNLYYAPPESFEIVAEAGHCCYDPGFDPADVTAAMVASVDEQGVQTPIEAMADGTNLVVVFGRGRVTACLRANEQRRARGAEPRLVPYTLFKGSDQDARDRITYENFHRKTPRPTDYANRIADLRRGGASDARIAQLLNTHVKLLPQYEAVLECAPAVRKALDARVLPMAAVPTLRALPRDEQAARVAAYEQAVGAGKSKQKALAEDVKRRPRGQVVKVLCERAGAGWRAQHVVRGGKGAAASGATLEEALAVLGATLDERLASKAPTARAAAP